MNKIKKIIDRFPVILCLRKPKSEHINQVKNSIFNNEIEYIKQFVKETRSNSGDTIGNNLTLVWDFYNSDEISIYNNIQPLFFS